MALLTFNNLAYYTRGLLTLSEVTNIITVTEAVTGSVPSVTLNVIRNIPSGYYITIDGETVTSVGTPEEAVGNNFFSTPTSLVAALRQNKVLNTRYEIYQEGSAIYLRGRSIGNHVVEVSTNLSSSYLNYSKSEGSASSPLWGGHVVANFYVDGAYQATLRKRYANNNCSFDVSSLLATSSIYGEAVPYSFQVSTENSDGSTTSLGTITAHTLNGYISNNSAPYLYASPMLLLEPFDNGENGLIYSTYSNIIPFSIYTTATTSQVTWTAYDSGSHSIATSSVTITTRANNITDASLLIPSTAFTEASYIILLHNAKTYRFNVQKPLKASNGAVRTWFRNNFGGIGFIDWSGDEEFSVSTNKTTYDKNTFDFYDGGEDRERTKILNIDYTETHTLTSFLLKDEDLHLIKNIAKSKLVWIENQSSGQLLYIIIDSVDISEVANYDGTYRVTITFTYSDRQNV